MKIPWFDADGNIIPDENDKYRNTIAPDLPSFVSPIDGKTYHGRAGLREHCAKHNVVPTEDLKGLPFRPPEVKPSKAEIRDQIQREMAKRGLL